MVAREDNDIEGYRPSHSYGDDIISEYPDYDNALADEEAALRSLDPDPVGHRPQQQPKAQPRARAEAGRGAAAKARRPKEHSAKEDRLRDVVARQASDEYAMSSSGTRIRRVTDEEAGSESADAPERRPRQRDRRASEQSDQPRQRASEQQGQSRRQGQGQGQQNRRPAGSSGQPRRKPRPDREGTGSGRRPSANDSSRYSRYSNGSGPSPRNQATPVWQSLQDGPSRPLADSRDMGDGMDSSDIILAKGKKKKKRKKHRKLKIVLAIVAVLLVAGGICGWQLYNSVKVVKAEASTLQENISKYSKDIRSGENEAAMAEAQAIAASAKVMHEETSGILWTVASKFPGIGTDVENVRVLSSVMDDLSQGVLIPLSNDLSTFSIGDLMDGGSINSEMLVSVLGTLGRYSPQINDAATKLGALEKGTMEQVNTVLDKVQPMFAEFDGLASEADRLARVVPGLLGADGQPAIYLIVAMNNVEIRAIGGFPGSWGTLTVDNGHLSLGHFESFATTGGREWARIDTRDGEDQIIGATGFPNPQFAAMIPDFPRAGELLASFWMQATGQYVHGVIGVDPIFVQYLLELTGEITTSEGITLDGTNAAKSIMHDTYLTLDSTIQDGYFSEVANLTFSKLVSGIGKVPPLTLVRTMTKAMENGHFQIWFPNVDEQALAVKYGADGGVNTDPAAPRLGVYFNDFTWSKIDYHLNPNIAVDKLSDNADGSKSYYVTLTLTNMINTEQGDSIDELTPYIYGDNPAKNDAADMLTTVLLMAPKGGVITDLGTDAELEGSMAEISLYYNDTWVLPTHTPGAETRTITFTVTTAPETAQEMTVDMTPTAKEIAGW